MNIIQSSDLRTCRTLVSPRLVYGRTLQGPSAAVESRSTLASCCCHVGLRAECPRVTWGTSREFGQPPAESVDKNIWLKTISIFHLNMIYWEMKYNERLQICTKDLSRKTSNWNQLNCYKQIVKWKINENSRLQWLIIRRPKIQW